MGLMRDLQYLLSRTGMPIVKVGDCGSSTTCFGGPGSANRGAINCRRKLWIHYQYTVVDLGDICLFEPPSVNKGGVACDRTK